MMNVLTWANLPGTLDENRIGDVDSGSNYWQSAEAMAENNNNNTLLIFDYSVMK